MVPVDKTLSPRKVADRLGISAESALELMLTGEIRTVRDEYGVDMVPVDAVDEYRKAHSVAAPASSEATVQVGDSVTDPTAIRGEQA